MAVKYKNVRRKIMKKHLFVIVSALVCALLLFGCAGSNSNQVTNASEKNSEPVFDLAEYKKLVSACRKAINDASLPVANVGQYEFTYWKAYQSIGGSSTAPDSMVDSAFESLAEQAAVTRDAVDTDYSDIRQQYKDIILIEIEGREAEEIDAAFRSMYDAYSSMYNLVTSPSGSLLDFGNALLDYADALTSSDENLSLFLDETDNANKSE